MRCAKCGADVKPTDPGCPNCAQICGEIKTMEDAQSDYCAYGGIGPDRRIHVRRINLSLGFWSRLLGIVLLMAVFIIILPLALLLTLIFATFWFILRRKY